MEAAATTTAQLGRKQRKFVQVLVCQFSFFFSRAFNEFDVIKTK